MKRASILEQTEAIMRGILEHLSREYRVKGEVVGEGSLLERITFEDSPVTVGFHEAERHKVYAITIFDGESGELVLDWVLLLGHVPGDMTHWEFCPVRQEVIEGHRRCEFCLKAEFAWPESRPEMSGYIAMAVALVVHEVKFALTLR